MKSRFFVELPGDKYGSTTRRKAVVEADIRIHEGEEMLVPIAPQHFVDRWPGGWYRDSFGGWAEVEGPARLLSSTEYDELLASLSDETKEQTANDLVTLRTGERVSRTLLIPTWRTLVHLFEHDPAGFYEIVMISRDPAHVLFGDYKAELIGRGLLQDINGQPNDVIRQIVLASSDGERLDMQIIDPVATDTE